MTMVPRFPHDIKKPDKRGKAWKILIGKLDFPKDRLLAEGIQAVIIVRLVQLFIHRAIFHRRKIEVASCKEGETSLLRPALSAVGLAAGTHTSPRTRMEGQGEQQNFYH